MVLAMSIGDIQYFMNMPVLDLLDFCSDYSELSREIEMRRREAKK